GGRFWNQVADAGPGACPAGCRTRLWPVGVRVTSGKASGWPPVTHGSGAGPAAAEGPMGAGPVKEGTAAGPVKEGTAAGPVKEGTAGGPVAAACWPGVRL